MYYKLWILWCMYVHLLPCYSYPTQPRQPQPIQSQHMNDRFLTLLKLPHLAYLKRLKDRFLRPHYSRPQPNHHYAPPTKYEKPNSGYDNGYSAPDSGYSAPDSGYSAPDSGYSAPDSGYSAPDSGYSAPNSGYSAPDSGYSAPDSGYSAPDSGYSAPNSGYSAPDSGYSAPDSGYSAPNSGYSAPNSGYSAPDSGYSAPDSGYSAPDSGYSAPNSGYSAPDSGYSAPDSGYSAPNSGYSAPDSGYSAPHSGYSAPDSGYSAPDSGYSAPDSGYSAPDSGYSAPNSGYSAPNSGYSAPNSGYSQPGYKPPSVEVAYNPPTVYSEPQTPSDYSSGLISVNSYQPPYQPPKIVHQLILTDDPLASYEPPKTLNSVYGPPTKPPEVGYSAAAPITNYGTPVVVTPSYSPPEQTYGQPNAQESYEQPDPNYGAPEASYNPPSNSYQSPDPSYNISPIETPQQFYNPLSITHATLQGQGISVPAGGYQPIQTNTYDPPPLETVYNAPSKAPTPSYSSPPQNPQPAYGSPEEATYNPPTSVLPSYGISLQPDQQYHPPELQIYDITQGKPDIAPSKPVFVTSVKGSSYPIENELAVYHDNAYNPPNIYVTDIEGPSGYQNFQINYSPSSSKNWKDSKDIPDSLGYETASLNDKESDSILPAFSKPNSKSPSREFNHESPKKKGWLTGSTDKDDEVTTIWGQKTE